MPIADAFIAWGRATELNNKKMENHGSNTWQIKFHFISLTTIMIIWALFFYKSILKKCKKKEMHRR